MPQLPSEVKEKLDNWFRSIDYNLIHYWKNFHGDCFYIVCGCTNGDGNALYFFRIFKVGDKWQLSEDHVEST